MSSQYSDSGPDSNSDDGPTALSVIEEMPADRAVIVLELRDLALALEGAEERTLYDALCRGWTPAYYARGKQLFHVHSFCAGIRRRCSWGLGPWSH